MKKLWTICIVLMLMLTLGACSTKDNTEASEQTLSEADSAQVTQEDTGSLPEGLPEGFPQSMPIYSDPQIIEADTYGEDGYTVVYMVSAQYDAVVSFYQQAFPGVEKEYDESDECYFENFDTEDGKVHVNGLTITDNDDHTAVFITLKYN